MKPLFPALAVLAAATALPLPASAQTPPPDADVLRSDARQISEELISQIAGELLREYRISGALRSVIVCKYTAPEVSSSVSRKYGVQIKRVSLRVRNPALGSPDAWEQEVLRAFDARAAAGEAPSTIEFGEVVSEPLGKYYRYMKAIPVKAVCLNCHGDEAQISAATRAQMNTEYPHDKATGYREGEIRGAVTYKKPL
ncbi:Tll0287-like domain-containing protein [Nitrogeniibacter aestuarii]|uniref:Tll0287-like domain-containing protein n=1 Tax=Nitrogeniibacter aestuarii TaxID=2815343 RepID=UPI001D123F29|nr:DUF3365 domain-containing protein [Nitrogeniibacter aestuarii]